MATEQDEETVKKRRKALVTKLKSLKQDQQEKTLKIFDKHNIQELDS